MRSLALRFAAPMIGALALVCNTLPAHAGPKPVVQGNQLTSNVGYSVPSRRSAHISRPDDNSPFVTLFDPAAADQAKVMHELGSVTFDLNAEIATAIESYYSQPKALPIWITGKRPNVKALQALGLIKQADDWGLDPSDYQVDLPSAAPRQGSEDGAKSLALFEVSLSEKMLMFLQDNFRGRIDPNQLSQYFDFKRKPVDLGTTIAQLAASPDLMPIFDRFMPSNPKFAQLAAELHFLRTSEQKGASKNADKVIVAMEELRWLPKEFPDRYVFINQPAYMAYYNEGGKVTLSMKAVIGQQDHQTNFFDASIKTVQFNPDWGVPQSIIRNEMLPHLKRDPGYLDRQGYVVSVKGKTMPSAKVDWTQPLENIGVVQPPGPENALGQLKILFPNPHDIYLHDTPARGKFASQDRMFSHGCVRLENPRAMAAAVLKTSVESVDQEIAGRIKKDVKVPEEVPVFISYFTAWPTADGAVEYFDDIYKRDAQTLSAMAATTASRNNQNLAKLVQR